MFGQVCRTHCRGKLPRDGYSTLLMEKNAMLMPGDESYKTSRNTITNIKQQNVLLPVLNVLPKELPRDS